ncbi:MAG: DoxX family protein [Lacibacter sp.]
MRKLFEVQVNSKSVDAAILITRVAAAVLMLTHGIPKLAGLFADGPVQFPGLFGLSPAASLGLTVFAEVLCSLFILFGLGTRLAVIPLTITMLVAVLLIHSADPFIKKEPAIHFLLLYVILFFTGSGRYSVDSFIQKKSLATVYTSR